MKPKLKPCPWCGQVPKAVTRLCADAFVVRCMNPYCRIQPRHYCHSSTETGALEDWNTRASDRKGKP